MMPRTFCVAESNRGIPRQGLQVIDALCLPRAGIRVRGLWEGMQRQGGGGNGPAPLGPNGVPVNVHDMVRDQVRASPGMRSRFCCILTAMPACGLLACRRSRLSPLRRLHNDSLSHKAGHNRMPKDQQVDM